jgi:glycosyltransferase involved in cell wall biosynthesis
MARIIASPLVSVILPFHNVELFLTEAVDSVLAQAFEDWELLLVDDGSQDASRRIALDYCNREPDRFRLLEHPQRENRGISASRNLGLRHARGEWVASLDGDDVWLPGRLALQVELTQRFPEVALFLGATRYWFSWNPDAKRKDFDQQVGGPKDQVVAPPNLIFDLYPFANADAPSMNTVLVRKDVAIEVGGWEDQFTTGYEDQAFLAKLYLDRHVYICSDVLDLYRQHGQSVSSRLLTGETYHGFRSSFFEWCLPYFESRSADPKLLDFVLAAKEAHEDYLGSFRYRARRFLAPLRRVLP